MESKSVRIGWIVMLILGVWWIFCGITMIAAPQVSFHAPYESATGLSWESVVAANAPATIDYINGLWYSHAVYVIAQAALIILIALYAYRRGQKWSWYALLAGGVVLWGGMLIHHIIIGAWLIIPIISLVLLAIALAVPAKDILTKKAT